MGLKKWSSEVFKSRQGELKFKSKRLKGLQEMEGQSVLDEIRMIHKDIYTLMDQDDL